MLLRWNIFVFCITSITKITTTSSFTLTMETTSQIIDGKNIAATIRQEIHTQLQGTETKPGLAVVLVGSRRDSQTYVRMKKKACAEAGIRSVGYDFEESITTPQLLSTIDELNQDPSIHGILVQLPLPSHISQDTILNAILPEKDVDGLHPENVAKLQLLDQTDPVEAPFSIPCTPLGCLVLLDRMKVPLEGKHCVVIGRSHLVGLPMARLLLLRNATVTIVHSRTRQIEEVCRTADVIVAAVGKAELVKENWVKEGAVVIDVGINAVDIVPTKPGGKTYKLVGDVDFDAVSGKTSLITPVPGGVGPMTIAMLLQNTYRAWLRATDKIACKDDEPSHYHTQEDRS